LTTTAYITRSAILAHFEESLDYKKAKAEADRFIDDCTQWGLLRRYQHGFIVVDADLRVEMMATIEKEGLR